MALLQCPDCGKKVSDGAEECPKCGCKLKSPEIQEKIQENKKKANKYKKIALWFWIGLFVLIFIGAKVSPDPNSPRMKNIKEKTQFMKEFGIQEEYASEIVDIIDKCNIEGYSVTEVTDTSVSLAKEHEFERYNYYPADLDSMRTFNLYNFADKGSISYKLVLENNKIYSLVIQSIFYDGMGINFDNTEYEEERFLYRDGNIIKAMTPEYVKEMLIKANSKE